LGELEVTFEEFTANPEVRTHRIKRFKKNGEVVWDKEKKIDKIKEFV